ncbi:MAG: primosomal protein N' [Thermomicrobiales bacterium]|nr:primosomal protein N' [Thermomicrobiales bacterium]
MAPTFAEVAVSSAWSSPTLSYTIPPKLMATIQVGSAVWVSLRGKPVQGVVLQVHDTEPAFATHPVIGPIDPPVVLTPTQLRTARWIARETASGLMDALSLFLPPGTTQQTRPYLDVTDSDVDAGAFTPVQRKLLNLLLERGETSLDAARTAMGSSLATVVPALEKAGAIQVRHRIVTSQPSARQERWVRLLGATDLSAFERAPKQVEFLTALQRRARLAGDGFVLTADLLAQTGLTRPVVKALLEKGAIEEIERPRGAAPRLPHQDAIPTLTLAQATAWEAIEHSLQQRAGETFLLYGVTGSGKTELYLRAAAWCLRNGRSSLILAPEIALSSQVAARFTARFGSQVTILHSALTPAERAATWEGIAEGAYPIVVGPRSALFAPVKDLGLIVLDEEHDQAYKQGETPRYHTRSVAEFLAGETGATLLLGSATPATETYWRAEQGAITRLDLPHRVGPALRRDDGAPAGSTLELPQVEIADMRLELHRGNTSLLSESLQELLGATLRRGEQAILLLNRRGMATVVLCRSCGLTIMCPYCDIPLVYHHDRAQLVCHRCDHREAPGRQCRSCGGPLDYFGVGTQRVESETQRLFPAARVLRWDQDIVRRRGGADGLLRLVEQGETDIIVGTQMVAKGFDLPLVTAVGVVNADVGLHLPDFRSGERAFSLLTQVAGRAGRRGPGSRVVIQSYTPEHYAIQAAAHHDYPGFYAEEIDFRRTHRYPPFVRLARFTFRHKNDAVCAQAADAMARKLALHARTQAASMDLLGPAPAFASRVRGEYQWQVIMRSPEMDRLLDGLPHEPGWVVDIDPQSLL